MTRPAAEGFSADRRTSFGQQAAAYANGRPSYPMDAVNWVLPTHAQTVLDLAAGTGRLTEPLLEAGVDVVAVEPLAEMRAHVPARARALDGRAEDIPLDDGTVDAVVVGQAFHWFDLPRAMTEITRVLRPGGALGLLWNLLDDADSATREFADLVGAEERTGVMRDDQPPPYADIEGMSIPQRCLFAHVERFDADRLADFVASRSQTILAPDDERTALLDAVRAFTDGGVLSLHFVCEAWRGVRSS